MSSSLRDAVVRNMAFIRRNEWRLRYRAYENINTKLDTREWNVHRTICITTRISESPIPVRKDWEAWEPSHEE